MRETMNDSDTKFAAEDESIISTNIIRKEEIGDQSSSVSVPEASIHILSTQNEDETDTSGQDEQNLLLPLNVLSINHLLLPINILPISHLLLPLNILLLLQDVLPISHPNLLLLLQLR